MIGGKNTTWKHGTNGALTTNTDFSAKTRSLSPSFDAEEVDATVFGDAYREFEQSFKNASISATYKYDTTVFGQIAAIYANGDEVTFEIGPDGTTTGKPKITGSMVIGAGGFSLPLNVGDLEEITVNWRVSGAVTFTTFS
jgi:hypothetical protein